MPYRTVTVEHPEGEPEVFLTRLDTDAFDEWTLHRAELAAAGKPDRPPDVDMPSIQAWLPHPGEEDHPYFSLHEAVGAETRAAHAGTEMQPLAAYSWSSPTKRTRLYLTLFTGSTLAGTVSVIECRIASEDPQSGEPTDDMTTRYPDFFEPDEVNEHVDMALAIIGEAMGPTDRVTTLSDFQTMDHEMEMAQAELAGAFGLAEEAARA